MVEVTVRAALATSRLSDSRAAVDAPLLLSRTRFTIQRIPKNMDTATKVSSHDENSPTAVGCPILRVDEITSTPMCARCFEPNAPLEMAKSRLEHTDTTVQEMQNAPAG